MTAGPDMSGIDKSLALELSMNGVLPFDDWVSVNTRKAEAMFGNQGVHSTSKEPGSRSSRRVTRTTRSFPSACPTTILFPGST